MLVVGLDEHHRPRAIEGALPGHILSVRNVETPSGSGSRSGKSTARKTQLPGGHRMTKKRMPAAETQREAGTKDRALHAVVSDNRPDMGPSGPARKGADVVR
jgi:hypothetical protein